MRQGKLGDLIHSSEKRRDLNQCSVEIFFEEIDSKENPIPGSQLVVSRTAYKNHKSDYSINGAKSNFTEVTDLLKRKGIDLDHQRFLILQGEVESIALMKPKAQNEHEDGLLEYIEDIIGTNKYIEKISENQVALTDIQRECSEKGSRLRIAEKEKNSLLEAKQIAEEYLTKESELLDKKGLLYHVSKFQAKKETEQISNEIEALEENFEAQVEKYEKYVNVANEIEKEYSAKSKAYEEACNQVADVIKEASKFEKQDIKLQENRKHLMKKIKSVEKSIGDQESTFNQKAQMMQNHSLELEKKQEEMKELSEKREKAEAELQKIRESLKDKTQVFQAKIDKERQCLAPFTAKIAKLESKIQVAKSEYEMLYNSIHSASAEISKLQEKIKDLLEEKAEREEEYKSLVAEKDLAVEQGQEEKQKLERIQNEKRKLKQEIQSEKAEYEDGKSSLNSMSSKGHVLEALMAETKSGRIKGVFGRLGDLGIIDSKYDVAISTACGALDHIVVDTTSTGQNCVEFLRANNLGRATFIILEKMKNPNPISGLPSNVFRLFDLIKPKDAKFAPAFYHSLRDTLVADNLQQANKLAYGQKRFKVVTLDGKVIDKSGTMSGGGNRQFKGGMKSSFQSDISASQLKKIEKSLEQKQEKLIEIVELESKLQKNLSEKDNQIYKIDFELSKIEMSLKSIDEQGMDIERQLKAISGKQTKTDPKEVKKLQQLETLIKQYAVDQDSERTASAEIEERIKLLQEKILEIGGVKLKAQTAKVESINEQISLCQSRMTKLQVELNGGNRNLNNKKSKLPQLEKERNELNEKLQALDSEIEEQRKQSKSILQQSEKIKNDLEDSKEELDDLKKKLEKSKKSVAKIKALEIEFKSKTEDLQRNLKKLNEVIKMSIQQIENISTLKAKKRDSNQITLYSDEDLEEMEIDLESLRQEINSLEDFLQTSQPNLTVIEEFEAKNEEFERLRAEFEVATEKKETINEEFDRLAEKRLSEFMAGFNQISQTLKEMYQLITLGGNAELELVDSLDPFSEGIIFSVMPPKKSWKNISNLSGGEKTLSSLALVFALHQFKPTPIYVMDEIDAALDFRNVSIVASYIKERTKGAQFIVISLRNDMFELADRLVGIYKTHDCTKTVSINPKQFAVTTQ